MAKLKNLDAILEQARFEAPVAEEGTVYMVSNADLRDSANEVCWPEQEAMEKALVPAIESKGYKVKRMHDYNPELKHGFINSQAMGNAVFQQIPDDGIVVVATSAWAYSHHILGALVSHEGPILTVANYSGTHPGLVGMSNLNASLLKHGRDFATVWSEDFSDRAFFDRLDEFFRTEKISYDTSHIHDFRRNSIQMAKGYDDTVRAGNSFAEKLLHERAIIGLMDEMCMGMENGVIPNELLYQCGMGKENISQSELLAEMKKVSDKEGQAVIDWCVEEGMTFHIGKDEATELTKGQLVEQGKMYVAAVRIAEKYGVAVIGIQYQQGLKDCCPASDLVEGLLNNPRRPPVISLLTGRAIRPGRAIPNANEVDGGCAVDLVLSDIIWNAFGEEPSANQEDVRWSRPYSGMATVAGNKTIDLKKREIWVELLSGSAPASHFARGYRDAHGYRQPSMYFPLGGSTLSGIGKPGEVVVSRVYIDGDGELSMNLMRGAVVGLPTTETENRLKLTTPEWPIKHLVRYGVTRDNMILHPSNHETILYASSAEMANNLMFAKASMAKSLGMNVYIWGDYKVNKSMEALARKAA